MSYIKKYYIYNSAFYEKTKLFINNSYNKKLKVDSFDIVLISSKKESANTYNIETNLVYKWDDTKKGEKKEETIIGRTFNIDITNNRKIVFNSRTNDPPSDFRILDRYK